MRMHNPNVKGMFEHPREIGACMVRFGLVALVILPPISLELKFLLTAPFVIWWMLSPWLVALRLDAQIKRFSVTSFTPISVLLAFVLVYLPFEAQGWLPNGPVPEGPKMSKQTSHIPTQEELDWITGNVLYQTREGKLATVCELIVLAVIVVVIAGGYVHYYYKTRKVCKKVGTKRQKQVEGTNPWPDDPQPPGTNRTRTVTAEFGAYFFEGYGTPTPEHLADCQCEVLPVIAWVTPAGVTPEPLRIYFPATNLVTFEDYLSEHGLTDGTNNSYSVDGVATEVAPEIFAYTNRTLTISANGDFSSNVVSVLQRSRDLVNWQTLFTVSSPPGSRNNFTDGNRPPLGAGFYRVVTR